MIIIIINCQISPRDSIQILVLAAAKGSLFADKAGAATHPRIPMGTAAKAQIPLSWRSCIDEFLGLTLKVTLTGYDTSSTSGYSMGVVSNR